MTAATVRDALLWCTICNYALLLLWFFLFVTMRKSLIDLSCSWFNLSESQCSALNYGGIVFYKILIIFFNLIPYLALTFSR